MSSFSRLAPSTVCTSLKHQYCNGLWCSKPPKPTLLHLMCRKQASPSAMVKVIVKDYDTGGRARFFLLYLLPFLFIAAVSCTCHRQGLGFRSRGHLAMQHLHSRQGSEAPCCGRPQPNGEAMSLEATFHPGKKLTISMSTARSSRLLSSRLSASFSSRSSLLSRRGDGPAQGHAPSIHTGTDEQHFCNMQKASRGGSLAGLDNSG